MESVTSSAAMAALPETFQEARDDIAGQIGLIWDQVKAPVIVPLLRLAAFLCLVMSVMLFVEKVYMAIVIVGIKLSGRRPNRRYKWEPLREDIELGNSAFPMVLVQIPMFNEKEVYKLSIGAACGLSWPSDRIIIQVLDDSTDPIIKIMQIPRFGAYQSYFKWEPFHKIIAGVQINPPPWNDLSQLSSH